eukprot:TRINITY_DN40506_c0_g1_i1.p2 TRINITY_DN40506_c0_g1~~TRINITY_DN40506_c0_g1_i1.p2  ORF type:complete len:521 (+),score=210.52 TRINITY_DN40506_c0_g1_i1:71-1564(+)
MPRELICIQVGQCGNQVGCQFWDLALQEHMRWCGDGRQQRPSGGGGGAGGGDVRFDDAMSSFFRAEGRGGGQQGERVPLTSLRARAIPIDMEEGVLQGLTRGKLRHLFDRRHFISDVSGAGNNWAVGHCDYGERYREPIMETVRFNAEACDSLQTFLMLHSLGGGTGSGLGTRILQELRDEYPTIYRFCSVVFPQRDDDVVTSPYNSVLALSQLVEHADCVLPVDNQQLGEIAARAEAVTQKDQLAHGGRASDGYNIAQPAHARPGRPGERKGGEAFAAMNYIVGSMLTGLTAGMRFPGELNVDLNELTTNLVPYPRLHFIHSAVAPIALSRTVSVGAKRVDQLFADSFDRRHQLIGCDPRGGRYFAACMLLRGDVSLGDATRNIEGLRARLPLVPWNTEGFKVGLCSVPAPEQPVSMLALANNSAIAGLFGDMRDRFMKLYQVRAHTHHYTDYIALEDFDRSLGVVTEVMGDYNKYAQQRAPFTAERIAAAEDLLF